MVRVFGGLGARLLAFGLALVLCAGAASAEPIEPQPITGGNLFGVFAANPTGEFGDVVTSEEQYWVVHLLEFAPSLYPGMLVPASFPAAFSAGELGLRDDNEFFFLGNLTGAPQHLLLSNSNPGETPSSAIGPPLHDILIEGSKNLLGAPGEPPVRLMSASAFWDLFEGAAITAQEFFGLKDSLGPNGPVSELVFGNFAADSGSEDLFGFDPPDRIGSLTGSPDSYSFTDAAGTTYNPIPEPTTLALVGGALVLGFGLRRRRNRRAA